MTQSSDHKCENQPVKSARWTALENMKQANICGPLTVFVICFTAFPDDKDFPTASHATPK